MLFNIEGTIVETPGDAPASGLRVEALDKDFGTDDYLGFAITGPDGGFTITFDESMFEDLGFERYPDIYFKVFRCGELLASTEKSAIWNAKKPNVKVKIQVPAKKIATGWVERHIYLKIEKIEKYSPVRPQEKVVPPVQYGRDCMRTKDMKTRLSQKQRFRHDL
jgi:hypothetical protein